MDENYYKELQNTLRSYDTKLWQIPSLFFIVVGFILANLNFNSLNSIKNGVTLLLGTIFLWILILLYNKAHLFNVSTQKKTNEFDNNFNSINTSKIKRIPLISMTDKELSDRIRYLEQEFSDNPRGNQGASFGYLQKVLGEVRVSWWLRTTMLLTFLGSFLFLVLYIVYIYSHGVNI